MTTSRRPLQRRRKYLRFARRSKFNAKPRRPSTTLQGLHILQRTWIDVEPGAQFDHAYPVAMKTEQSSSARTNHFEKKMEGSKSGD